MGAELSDETEKAVERLDEVGRRAARIAHELNNLLTCIRTSAALLLEEERDPERLEDLRRIEEATARATELARELRALPRAADDEPAPAAKSERARAAETSTVLLVEHDPPMRIAAFRALKELGYRVIPCGDGEEAVEMIRERRAEVTLVLLALGLPRRAGQPTLRALAEVAPALPVVIAAEPGELDEARALLDSGARGLSTKPYERRALAQVLSLALAGKKSGAPASSAPGASD